MKKKRKTEREKKIENLENARKVKASTEPRALKTAARVLKVTSTM